MSLMAGYTVQKKHNRQLSGYMTWEGARRGAGQEKEREGQETGRRRERRVEGTREVEGRGVPRQMLNVMDAV